MPPRVFLDWSLPLLPALADWLLAATPQLQLPDLSGTAVILPTAAAGRRLREILAAKAGETGLLSPRVVTPEILITWATEHLTSIAGRGEQITAWASVLEELPLEQWRDLFPIDPVSQDFRWATGAAADLLKLRRTLEEGGRDLTMAAEDLGPAHPEAARWNALANLERLAVARLEEAGWKDSATVRLWAADNPILPDEVKQIILAGVPDSIRLVRIALEKISQGKTARISVIIHAPESLAGAFDDWGRPLPEIWAERNIRLPKGNDSITLTARPEDAAHGLVKALTDPAMETGLTVIGSADPEVSAPLARHAAAAGLEVYDPDGQPLGEHAVSWLFKTLTHLLRSGAWSAASQLLRLPDVLSALCRDIGIPNQLRALEDWDAFQTERLPQNLTQAAGPAAHWADGQREARSRKAENADEMAMPVVPRMIAWFQKQVSQLKRPPLPDSIYAFTENLLAGKLFTTAADRQTFTEALTAWQEALESVERGAAAFLPSLPAADRLELAGSLVRDARLYPPHTDDAHAVHGWLELAWQDAPHLVIAGLNEGFVPDSVQGDAWLPDSVRALLDLKTNATRLARDSYLLTTMIESRRSHGSIRLLAGRMTAAGDPLKPSRLLLRCPGPDLPERALRLFPREIADESGRAPSPPWHRAWMLKAPGLYPDAKIFKRLSVTAFGDYLKCPFRFYLKHVLKMEPFDATQAELNARAAGNLFHNTMEDFHKNAAMRDSADASAISAFLHGSFENRIQETYGPALTVPVVMQLEVIRNCLSKAAEIHAAESENGWRFKEVELAFPKLVTINGTEIRGRIDLIQHHPDFGYRILDYKTASVALKPADAHLKSVRSKSAQELSRQGPNGGWATLEHEAKFYLWQNLQLPLYAKIMAAHYDVERVAVGYVNLPRAVSEAGLEMWDHLDDEIIRSAWACAEGVIGNIQRGVYWPPGPVVKYDDFESLIYQDAEASFDGEFIRRVQSMIASGEFQPTLSPV